MVGFFERAGDIPPNFWLGTTVTGPATLGRLRELHRLRDIGTHDNLLWVSFEPLMAPIEFSIRNGNYVFESTPQFVDDELSDFDLEPLIDWAVVGGGSHMRRTTRPEWIADLLYWLEAAEVPAFFKQWGDLSANPDPRDPTARENGGYAKGGRMINGRTLDGMPSYALGPAGWYFEAR
jgi:protein gp37